jgi:apolipoprotein D and lipocalin family protein
MMMNGFTSLKRSLPWVVGVSAWITVMPAAQADPRPELQSVSTLDLPRYQGRWYQIAYYPNRFQKQCVSNTTADYKLLEGGTLEVVNQCRTADGTVSKAVAEGRVQQPRFLTVPTSKPPTLARLEVRFAPGWLSWLPWVWADYWVIQLADDYRYVVVGEPHREYLWILARTPTLDPQDRDRINARLLQQAYDPTALVDETHP